MSGAALDGFRVTVEDLATGDRQSMIVHSGDYVLIPFAPCHLAHTQADLIAGTHVLTVKGYRPTVPTTTEGTPDAR